MLGIHALRASLELLMETGISRISQMVSGKIQFLIDNIENNNGTILSARDPQRRAGIVTFRTPGDDPKIRYEFLMQHGVVCALRGGGIRFSPHFYTPERALQDALSLAFQPIK
jgi:selenocysteine lyase/cysteine desulfurase